MKKNPHRIEFTVSEAFKNQVKLLAAKWNVKTNVAVERAVALALTREPSADEKTLQKIMASHIEDILRFLTPP